MDEELIKRIAQEVYEKNQGKSELSALRVNKHVHNGTDAPRVNQDNIEPGTYAMLGATSTTSETFTVETFPSIDTITLHGIAADGLGRKAHLNGNAAIGNCFQYGSSVNSVSLVQLVGGTYSNIIQSSSSIYIDATAGGGTTVVTDVSLNKTSGSFVTSTSTTTDSFLLSDFSSADAVTNVSDSTATAVKTASLTLTTASVPGSNLANARVSATGNTGDTTSPSYIVYVTNEASAVVASMVVKSWTNNTITFETTLAANWYITFFLTMS